MSKIAAAMLIAIAVLNKVSKNQAKNANIGVFVGIITNSSSMQKSPKRAVQKERISRSK